MQELPNQIADLEKEIATLETKLSNPDFIRKDRAGFDKSAALLETALQQKDDAEERWLEIEIKREALAL